ncbi:hypothetical protein FRC10_002986 [Ceratobasidium sp. 414]|nr:hypothetical protein FRC10_002986 [Ceratobasidium sp. 414]
MSVTPELLQDLESTIYNVRLSVILGGKFPILRHPPCLLTEASFFALVVVGYTTMVYDHALTFTDEIQYIWKAEKTPVTFLFLLLYDKGGISSYTSHRFCITWYYTEAVWYVCSFGITHALVAMRIVFDAMTSRSHTVHYEPLLKLCYVSVAPFLWACWVPPLILEAVLFTLSCVQAVRAGRYAARTPILFVLFRDVCSIFNMVTWIVAPPTLVALAKYFCLAIVNVMISRLVLNLRSCQKEPLVSSVQVHVAEEVEMSPSKAQFLDV